MPVLTAAEIERTLQAALPINLHKTLPAFASMLAGITNGEALPAQVNDEMVRTGIAILEALVGQSLRIRQTVWRFEPENRITITGNAPDPAPINSSIQVGDITNSSTIAIGHGATAITITLPGSENKPQTLFDLSKDDDDLGRFY
jgi:hypothetical protein